MTAEIRTDIDLPSQPAVSGAPVMLQYHEIKRAHPGCLLFFRMGDFFELFFEDAIAAAPALDIALTKRGRHDGADIPMCGVPVHTAEAYLARLIRAEWKAALTPLANPRFDSDAARRRLEGFYGVKALDGFGSFGRAEIAAAGALVDYVALTQPGGAPYLAPPQRVLPQSVMQIDAATRRNLELTASLSGERRGSLLATIDRTLTGAGGRLLAEQLAAPLTLPEAIMARLDAVQFLVDRPEMRAALRLRLRHCPDIERALTRLSLGRGGPRDLAALRDGLGETAALRAPLAAPGLVPFPRRVAGAGGG